MMDHYYRGHTWRGQFDDGSPSWIVYYGRLWWPSFSAWMMPGQHEAEF